MRPPIAISYCLLFSVLLAMTAPCAWGKDEVELTGARVKEFERTNLIVRRTIAMDIDGKAEEKDIDIPVVIRSGSLYLDAAAADRLVALRAKIAEFKKKSDEMQKMGETIKNEYAQIMTLGRPNFKKE